MVQPNRREINQVSSLGALSAQEAKDLYDILLVLGFDAVTIALVWNKDSEDEVLQAFPNGNLSEQQLQTWQSTKLSGSDLIHFCTAIGLRPGVVQRKLNFDESRLKTKKVGHTSTRKPRQWIGPPQFCLNGAASEGKAFREICQSPAMAGQIPERSTFDQKVLQQISDGKYPVRLQQLRDVVTAEDSVNLQHPKLKYLQDALAAFPAGIKSVDDVFAAPQKEEIQSEGRKMSDVDRIFAKAFVDAKLGAVLASLLESFGLSGQACELLGWDQDDLLMVKDGDSGVVESELRTLLEATGQNRFSDIQQGKYDKLAAFLKVNSSGEPLPAAPKTAKPSADKSTSSGVEGQFGEVWHAERNYVQVGDVALRLIGDDIAVVAKRVFRTLDAIRDDLGLTWPLFCKGMTLDYKHVTLLEKGSLPLTSKAVAGLIVKLNLAYSIKLSIEQLFGLAELPKLEQLETAEASATKDEVPAEAVSKVEQPTLVTEPVAAVKPPLEPVSAEKPVAAEQVSETEPVDDVKEPAKAPKAPFIPVHPDVLTNFSMIDQPKVALFIRAAVDLRANRKMRDMLFAAGIDNKQYNTQVLKGSKTYSYQQLVRVAEELGLTYEQLIEADIAALETQKKEVQPMDQKLTGLQIVAQNIARFVANHPTAKIGQVLASAGINNRRYNAFVLEGKEGYDYTDAHLAAIAAELGVPLAKLKEGVDEAALETVEPDEGVEPPVEIEGQTPPESPAEVPTEAGTSLLDEYDPYDHPEQKALVGAQVQLLYEHVGGSKSGFVRDVSGNPGVGVIGGKTAALIDDLEGLVAKYKGACPWLTVEWFLADNEIPLDTTDDGGSLVAEVEPAEVEPAEVEPAEVEPAEVEPAEVEPAEVEPAEVEPAEVEPAEVEPAEVEPAEVEPAEVEPAEVEPAEASAPAGPHESFDWKKIFFALADAGYVSTATLTGMLKQALGHSNMSFEWQELVLELGRPVLSSVAKMSDDEVLADRQLSIFTKLITARDLLLLSKLVD